MRSAIAPRTVRPELLQPELGRELRLGQSPDGLLRLLSSLEADYGRDGLDAVIHRRLRVIVDVYLYDCLLYTSDAADE